MNKHNEALANIENLKKAIEIAHMDTENNYDTAIEREIERIGLLKTSEVTVAENEWYQRAKGGHFFVNNRGRL